METLFLMINEIFQWLVIAYIFISVSVLWEN
jgi:hypothetical protein